MKRVCFLLLLAPFVVGAILAALVKEIAESLTDALLAITATLDRWSR